MTGTEDVVAQQVTVTPTAAAQTIIPTGTDPVSGKAYNYLSQVNVAAIPRVDTENQQGGITVTIG